jgi:5-formyltetrahydrofolate cyclo-ligase
MKKELRKEIKKKIKTINPEDKRIFSHTLLEKIEQLPEFERANTILAFWSLPDEIQTHAFLDKWSAYKCILLPVIDGENLNIKYYRGKNTLKTAAYNISEPTGPLFKAYDKIDLVLVPGVGFDKEGNRLGRGKGYYDKLLPLLSGVKVGICFSCQIVDCISPDAWDIKMDKVITPDCVLKTV